jgi:hypothetical protein
MAEVLKRTLATNAGRGFVVEWCVKEGQQRIDRILGVM